MYYYNLRGESSASYMILLGQNSWKHERCFPLEFVHVDFPFADLAMYFFTIINHSLEDDEMLRLVKSSWNIIKLGGGLWTINISPCGRSLPRMKTEFQRGRVKRFMEADS